MSSRQLKKISGYNETEALKTKLIGFFDMKRLRDFYIYLDKVVEDNPMTWGDLDLKNQPMKDVYKKYKISEQAQDFLGHALALHRDDTYMD